MDAIQEVRQHFQQISEKCPKCKGNYVGGRCRDCNYKRLRSLKLDAKAILKARGLR